MISELWLNKHKATAAALEEGLSLALEWGMGIFELKKEGLWLDEGLEVLEKYKGVEWEWIFCNNVGVLRIYLGKG